MDGPPPLNPYAPPLVATEPPPPSRPGAPHVQTYARIAGVLLGSAAVSRLSGVLAQVLWARKHMGFPSVLQLPMIVFQLASATIFAWLTVLYFRGHVRFRPVPIVLGALSLVSAMTTIISMSRFSSFGGGAWRWVSTYSPPVVFLIAALALLTGRPSPARLVVGVGCTALYVLSTASHLAMFVFSPASLGL